MSVVVVSPDERMTRLWSGPASHVLSACEWSKPSGLDLTLAAIRRRDADEWGVVATGGDDESVVQPALHSEQWPPESRRSERIASLADEIERLAYLRRN